MTFVCTKCNVEVDGPRCAEGHRARRTQPIWIAVPQGVLIAAFVIFGSYYGLLLMTKYEPLNRFLSSGGHVPIGFLIPLTGIGLVFIGSMTQIMLAARYHLHGGPVRRLIPVVLVRGISGLATFGLILAFLAWIAR